MCFRLGKIPVVLPFDPCQPTHRPAGQAWIQTVRYFMQKARPAHDPPDEHDCCIGMDAQGEGWVIPTLSIVGREPVPACGGHALVGGMKLLSAQPPLGSN